MTYAENAWLLAPAFVLPESVEVIAHGEQSVEAVQAPRLRRTHA